MTTQEIERELILMKQTLQQLQIAVDKMSAMLSVAPAKQSTQWLSLIGVGKEIWQDVDANKYINTERNSWN